MHISEAEFIENALRQLRTAMKNFAENNAKPTGYIVVVHIVNEENSNTAICIKNSNYLDLANLALDLEVKAREGIDSILNAE